MTKTKSNRFQLKFFAISIFILAIIGYAASLLPNKVAAIVGLLSFLLSLMATVFFPNSQSDWMRVARILGDVGSTVLVYSTLNSYFGNWVVITTTLIVYALLARRLYRDL
ncbi:TPA: hypothetical protein QHS71_002209 [Escherichia coli]|nr:hypothetical protein [Escherichia coli]